LGLAAPTPGPVNVGERSFADSVDLLHRLTSEDLAEVNRTIMDVLWSPVPMIPDLAGHLLRSGGKRIRPMLTLASARLFGYEGEEHVRLAAAVELIHAATLLHDDVVDSSALRRGSQTANVIWGNKESVLVGDFVFSRAFELMVAVGDLRVLQILSSASGIIAEGEVLQLSTQSNLDASPEMYLSVIEAKTAALFAAATHAGAAIARCEPACESALRRFGNNLGIAYQLVDDALDYAGSDISLGKRAGDDFREGKVTLPVAISLERATGSEREFWRRTIGELRQHNGDFEIAREIVTRTGAVEETIARARRFTSEALAGLESVRATSETYKSALADLAVSAVARSY
jgi:octaprenyl-diphosphate synthase